MGDSEESKPTAPLNMKPATSLNLGGVQKSMPLTKSARRRAEEEKANGMFTARIDHPKAIRDAMYPWLENKSSKYEVCVQAPSVNEDAGKHKDPQKLEKIKATREAAVKKMLQSGLSLYRLDPATDDDKTYYLIGAPLERFMLEGDRIDMEKKFVASMRVKDETEGIWKEHEEIVYKEFEIDRQTEFLQHAQYHPKFEDEGWLKGKDRVTGGFSSTERQRMIWRILRDPVNFGGCFFDMEKDKIDGVWQQFFNLHHLTWLQLLSEVWVGGGVMPPIDSIRDYFGEKVAFYFAFLAHYTQGLAILSCMSIPFFLIQMVSGNINHSCIVIYVVLVNVWFTLFISFWKRTENTLAYRWDMLDFKEDEEPRPEFYRAKGVDMKVGFQVEHGFVEVDKEQFEGLKPSPFFPNTERARRQRIGYVLTFCMMCFGGTGNIVLMTMKLYLQDMLGSKPGMFIGAFCTAMWVGVLNMLWLKTAKKLTEWETWRTETEFEDSLILKTFAFTFVNSYSSFMYVAFLKAAHFRLLNTGGPIYNAAGELSRDFCRNDDCTFELMKLLAVFLVCQEGARNFKGTVMPKIKRYLQNRKMKTNTKDNIAKNSLKLAYMDRSAYSEEEKLRQQVSIEASLPDYDGTYPEYAEMVIQSGFVTLFAAAFPLSPFLCLLNNLIERKTDAMKLLALTKKPKYAAAAGVGSFVTVFYTVSLACVVTNVMILFFTSDALCEWIDCHAPLMLHTGGGFGVEMNSKFLCCAILEHVLIIFKLILRTQFADMPPNIASKVVMKNFQDAYQEQIADISAHSFQRCDVSDEEYANLKVMVDPSRADSSVMPFDLGACNMEDDIWTPMDSVRAEAC